MSAKAVNRKMETLYAGLGPVEIRRMQARLGREHNPQEMNRFSRAVPDKYASHYNEGLRLLRVINGTVPDWFTAFHLGMERDRLRFQHAISLAAYSSLARITMGDIWKIAPYPVTESEYRALVKLERSELHPLEDFADAKIWGGDEKLRPELAALTAEVDAIEQETWNALSDAEKETYFERFNAGVISAAKEAIKRGELPKPKQKPKDASRNSRAGFLYVDESDSTLWFPYGALHDWALGTTEETFEPLSVGYAVPIVNVLDDHWEAHWSIRPDSEAEAVKAQRAKLRDVFLGQLRIVILPGEREQLPSFEPPLTLKERERAAKEAENWGDVVLWSAQRAAAEMALDAAKTHGEHRIQFEDLLAALEIVKDEDFGGEDPVLPEYRALWKRTQEEADQFVSQWESMDGMLANAMRDAMGLETPKDEAGKTDLHALYSAPPIPTKEHDVATVLKLIRQWGEA